jgi:hypothetical protein
MRKARKLSNGGAIRQVATYNLGFLYLWKGDFDMGAKWLPKIRKTKSRVDSLIVDQIFDFCDMWKLAEQNNAINFWLAFLSFHKRNDVPSSQTHLLKFIELATDTEKNALHQEILQISRL